MDLFSRNDNPAVRKMIASEVEEAGLPARLPVGLAPVSDGKEIDQHAHLRREMTAVRVERVNAERLSLERGQQGADLPGGYGRTGDEARQIGETKSGFGRVQASALE